MLNILRPSTLFAALFACVCAFLKAVGSTTLFEDNMAHDMHQNVSGSTSSTPRMQHLDARYHWLREQVVIYFNP